MTLKKLLWGALGVVASYAAMAALLHLTCRYNLRFLSDISGYYADPMITGQILCSPGGAARLVSLMLISLFGSPTAAVLITAGVLTLTIVACAAVIRKVSHTSSLVPLALAPAAALAATLCNTDCLYDACVALPVSIGCVWAVMMLRSVWMRLAAALVLTALLAWAIGPAAMLFAVLMVIVEVASAPRIAAIFMLCPAAMAVIGWAEVRSGIYFSISRAISPDGYFTAWRQVADVVWSPWWATVVAVAVACLAGRIKITSTKHSAIAAIAAAIAIVIFAQKTITAAYDPAQSAFVELSVYAGEEDWDAITRRCRTLPMNDVRCQNLLNLALAQKGKLSDRLFKSPCAGSASLWDTENKNPLMYMALSDIFYSAGHISLARKYAFEANEAMQDLSPRMLRRLVDTNLICGELDVARKYLALLEKTRTDAVWLADRIAAANSDAAVAAHPELGPKRRNLFPDNRFAGSRGIDDDLRQILRSNPDNRAAMDYLGSYYLLNRDVPRFAATVEEFYGTKSLPSLGTHFQEGIAVAMIATGEPLDVRYRLDSDVMKRCRAFWAEHKPQPESFWHYLRSPKQPPR